MKVLLVALSTICLSSCGGTQILGTENLGEGYQVTAIESKTTGVVGPKLITLDRFMWNPKTQEWSYLRTDATSANVNLLDTLIGGSKALKTVGAPAD